MIQGGDPTGTGRGGESIYGKNFEVRSSKPYVRSLGPKFEDPSLVNCTLGGGKVPSRPC